MQLDPLRLFLRPAALLVLLAGGCSTDPNPTTELPECRVNHNSAREPGPAGRRERPALPRRSPGGGQPTPRRRVSFRSTGGTIDSSGKYRAGAVSWSLPGDRHARAERNGRYDGGYDPGRRDQLRRDRHDDLSRRQHPGSRERGAPRHRVSDQGRGPPDADNPAQVEPAIHRRPGGRALGRQAVDQWSATGPNGTPAGRPGSSGTTWENARREQRADTRRTCFATTSCCAGS